jgi:hypothetical protein
LIKPRINIAPLKLSLISIIVKKANLLSNYFIMKCPNITLLPKEYGKEEKINNQKELFPEFIQYFLQKVIDFI